MTERVGTIDRLLYIWKEGTKREKSYNFPKGGNPKVALDQKRGPLQTTISSPDIREAQK